MLNIAFALLFLFQQPVASDEVEISTSPTGTHQCDEGFGICTWTGDVVVLYQDVRVTADSVTFYKNPLGDFHAYDLTASDHVKFTRGKEHMEGDHLLMNVKTKEGT